MAPRILFKTVSRPMISMLSNSGGLTFCPVTAAAQDPEHLPRRKPHLIHQAAHRRICRLWAVSGLTPSSTANDRRATSRACTAVESLRHQFLRLGLHVRPEEEACHIHSLIQRCEPHLDERGQPHQHIILDGQARLHEERLDPCRQVTSVSMRMCVPLK